MLISGSGFGDESGNICVSLLQSDRTTIPLRVLTASDTGIRAELGPVPPTAVPGRIVVRLGTGADQEPGFDSLFEQESPVSVWRQDPSATVAVSRQQLTPVAEDPAAGQEWTFGTVVSDGIALLRLTRDWQRGDVVSAHVKLVDTSTREGYALHIPAARATDAATLGEGAQSICEMIQLRFAEAGIPVECQLLEINANLVQLNVLPGKGRLLEGHFTICVTEPPQGPEITSVAPNQGSPGDIITIRGSGFGQDPNAVSVGSALPFDGAKPPWCPWQPMEVIAISDTLMRVRVGPVPPEGGPVPNADPAPIIVTLGNGVRATCRGVPGDIAMEELLFAWEAPPGSQRAVSPLPFVSLPSDPPENVQWFFSGAPMNADVGELVVPLDGDWAEGSVVSIELHAHDVVKDVARALRAPAVRLDAGGSAVECAQQICEIIRCSFSDLLSRNVLCRVEDLGDGTGNLVVSLPDGVASTGSLIVCVDPPAEGPTLRVDGFRPLQGGVGTEISIFGKFPSENLPTDFCAMIASPSGLLPLDVLRLEEIDGTQALVARVGAVPSPAAGLFKPGPIHVGLGSGVRAVPEGIEVLSWSWSRPTATAVSSESFRPVAPAKPIPCYYGGPTGGALQVDLPPPQDWQPNTEFDIRLKAFGPKGLPGFGVHIPGCVSPMGTDAPDRLCKAIESTLALSDTDVECQAQIINQDGVPSAIRLRVANPAGAGPIADGAILVELDKAPRPAPVIVGHSPDVLRCTKPITIFGRNFPLDRADLSLNLIAYWDERPDLPGHGRSTPLNILSLSEDRIVAEMLVNPELPDVTLINLAVGSSVEGAFALEGDDPPVLRQPARVWRMGPEAIIAHTPSDQFIPLADCDREPGDQRWYLSGPPEGGELCLFIDGDWSENTDARIACRLRQREPSTGFDLDVPQVTLGSGSSLECARAICAVISQGFDKLGGVTVECEASDAGDGRAKLTLRLPGGSIDGGSLDVYATPAPNDDPVITGFDPREGEPGTRVEIQGRNFGTNPDDICAVVAQPNGGALPIQIVQSAEGAILGTTGICLEAWDPGALDVTWGRGARTPVEGFPSAPWVWQLLPAPPKRAISSDEFTPLPPAAVPEGEEWYVGDPPRNGEIQLFLRNDWGPETEVEIWVRVNDREQGLSRALHVRKYVLPGGKPIDSGRQVCAAVEQAFAAHDLPMSCQVVREAPGFARLALTLPDGDISSGHFGVRALPTPAVDPKVVVESVDTDVVEPGGVVTIRGSGFGDDPDDLSLTLLGGGTRIPLRAIAASDDEVTARVAELVEKPIDFKPGPIRVVRGDGATTSAKPVDISAVLVKPVGFQPADILKPVDLWGWRGDDANAGFSKPVDFKPVGPAAGIAGGISNIDYCLVGGANAGDLTLTINDDWPSGTRVRLYCRFTGDSGRAYHMQSQRVIFGGGTAAEHALAMLGVIQTTFLLIHSEVIVGQVDEL
ncbi:MAG: IPT/TIG domain-containing protein, partial [Planctomycetota bacterium]